MARRNSLRNLFVNITIAAIIIIPIIIFFGFEVNRQQVSDERNRLYEYGDKISELSSVCTGEGNDESPSYVRGEQSTNTAFSFSRERDQQFNSSEVLKISNEKTDSISKNNYEMFMSIDSIACVKEAETFLVRNCEYREGYNEEWRDVKYIVELRSTKTAEIIEQWDTLINIELKDECSSMIFVSEDSDVKTLIEKPKLEEIEGRVIELVQSYLQESNN